MSELTVELPIMKLISFKAPTTYLEGLDELVRAGVYSSRSEAIRIAIRDLLKRELDWGTDGLPISIIEAE